MPARSPLEKKTCPFCELPVCKLKRHLMGVHRMTERSAAGVASLQIFSKKAKRPCSLCGKWVSEMGHHLVRTHHMSSTSDTYLELMGRRRTSRQSASESGDRNVRGTRGRSSVAGSSAKLGRRESRERLAAFAAQLKRPDRKSLNNKNALQHVRQVEKIWLSVGEDRLGDWSDPEQVIVPWLVKAKQDCSLSSATLRSYCYSLRLFIRFLREKKLVTGTSDWDNSLKHALGNLRKAYAVEQGQYRQHARELLLEQTDFHAVRQSDAYKRGKQALQGDATSTVSRSVHRDILAFLCFELLAGSAQRAGAILNMTIGEFRRASYVPGKALYVARIFRHKTLQDGPAPLFIQEARMPYFNTYLRLFRGQALDAERYIAFPGRDPAKDTPSSYLADLLNRRFRSCLTDPAKPLTPTNVRKSIVSTLLTTDPLLGPDLGKAMTHSVQTQRTFYQQGLSDWRGAEVSQAIRSRLTETFPSGEPSTSKSETRQVPFGETAKRSCRGLPSRIPVLSQRQTQRRSRPSPTERRPLPSRIPVLSQLSYRQTPRRGSPRPRMPSPKRPDRRRLPSRIPVLSQLQTPRPSSRSPSPPMIMSVKPVGLAYPSAVHPVGRRQPCVLGSATPPRDSSASQAACRGSPSLNRGLDGGERRATGH